MSMPNRAAAVAQLRAAFDDQKLDRRTYDERVAKVLAADTDQELRQLLSDLPGYGQLAPTFDEYPHGPRAGGFADDDVVDPLTGQPWTDFDDISDRRTAMAPYPGSSVPDSLGRQARPRLPWPYFAILALLLLVVFFIGGFAP